MSNLKFHVTEVDGNPTIAVFDYADGYEKVVARSHPNFQSILVALTDVPVDDDKVKSLVDPTIGLSKALQVHFGDRVTADLHKVYLDGIPLKGEAADLLNSRLRAGDPDWLRLAKFLVNLDANPTRNVHDKIWGWIKRYGATITEDGFLVGYKGLAPGRVSAHSGPNNFIDGALYGEPDVSYQVPHEVGTTISKRRQDVDPGPQACSVGLHVGSYNYALTFGENRSQQGGHAMGSDTFAIVVFNPADVVAVEGDWKIRVCSYKVEKFIDPSEDILAVTPEYNTDKPEVKTDSVEVEDEIYDGDSNEPGDVTHDGAVEDDEPTTEIEPVEVTGTEPGTVLVTPEKGTALNGALSLTDWAKSNPVLMADLADGSKGHKAIARIYSDYTTESSVRRFRKAAGIKTTLRAKVSG